MGLLSGWFGKAKPEDDEQVLAALANDIKKRQTRLAEIHLRERRWTLLGTIYTLSAWVAYVSLWYMNVLPNFSNHPRNTKFERIATGSPVFIGPIIILFIRRIVQIWFTRKGNAEEKSLIALKTRQRDKVEEIKKRTNYYSTRNLIERYDESTPTGSPVPKRPGQGTPVPIPMTPQRPQGQPVPLQMLQTPKPLPPNLQQHLSPSPQRPQPPPRKQWFDKLADAILGDDDSSAPAASRYALICEKCFAHNGLVKENVWEETQYVCPKCGHFNPSFRSLREARQKGGRPSVSPPRNGVAPNANGGTKIGGDERPERSRSRPREEGGAEVGEEVTEGASVRMDIDS
ncbi:hypothetical protein BXZ70DRAFT_900916 [Cristinia sonorae]|uniref:Endoplasmic reticulum junction formation protein lunapark n=1 Tax=Cristinia sonorae TaxID=1940300 RepID=A0A8K0UER8_9AGAR|nr:hypothetical protein BXZ70DRAFT_900916 [Cristinia sonorae]